MGPRQAGKSTWIREVLTHFEAPVLVLHAEEPRIRELAHSPALALDALAEVLSPETLLLFEEVQHLAEAPRAPSKSGSRSAAAPPRVETGGYQWLSLRDRGRLPQNLCPKDSHS